MTAAANRGHRQKGVADDESRLDRSVRGGGAFGLQQLEQRTAGWRRRGRGRLGVAAAGAGGGGWGGGGGGGGGAPTPRVGRAAGGPKQGRACRAGSPRWSPTTAATSRSPTPWARRWWGAWGRGTTSTS